LAGLVLTADIARCFQVHFHPLIAVCCFHPSRSRAYLSISFFLSSEVDLIMQVRAWACCLLGSTSVLIVFSRDGMRFYLSSGCLVLPIVLQIRLMRKQDNFAVPSVATCSSRMGERPFGRWCAKLILQVVSGFSLSFSPSLFCSHASSSNKLQACYYWIDVLAKKKKM
jgi:hypothetical protein